MTLAALFLPDPQARGCAQQTFEKRMNLGVWHTDIQQTNLFLINHCNKILLETSQVSSRLCPYTTDPLLFLVSTIHSSSQDTFSPIVGMATSEIRPGRKLQAHLHPCPPCSNPACWAGLPAVDQADEYPQPDSSPCLAPSVL